MDKHLVLRRACRRGTVGDHKPGVEPSVSDKEGGQTGEVRVHEPLDAPLTDLRNLVDADGQVIKHLGGVLAVKVAP